MNFTSEVLRTIYSIDLQKSRIILPTSQKLVILTANTVRHFLLCLCESWRRNISYCLLFDAKEKDDKPTTNKLLTNIKQDAPEFKEKHDFEANLQKIAKFNDKKK
jgi:hypothetical protein